MRAPAVPALQVGVLCLSAAKASRIRLDPSAGTNAPCRLCVVRAGRWRRRWSMHLWRLAAQLRPSCSCHTCNCGGRLPPHPCALRCGCCWRTCHRSCRCCCWRLRMCPWCVQPACPPAPAWQLCACWHVWSLLHAAASTSCTLATRSSPASQRRASQCCAGNET